MYAGTSHTGIVVTDAALKFYAFNNEALQILTFPESPEKIQDVQAFLRERLRTRLFERPNSAPTNQLKSGRRMYNCRTFPVDVDGNDYKNGRRGMVLMLERKSNGLLSVDSIAQRFALTERERETVKLLFEGLTSKEIANRMKISPHTVNAFVRLIMVKMGVSNRSGIVGKIARLQS
jgi:DNA-binding CsgD family transcriptional regulator